MDIEDSLQSIYDLEGGGYKLANTKEALQNLEKHRRKILEYREVAWHLKIREIWL